MAETNNAYKKKLSTYRAFWLTVLVVSIANIFITAVVKKLEENVSVLKPLHIFFKDFDYTDMYYKWHKGDIVADSANKIAVINSFGMSAGKVADLADSINLWRPDVIGLDYILDENTASADSAPGVRKLRNLFARSDNLVVGFGLDELYKASYSDSLIPGTRFPRGKSLCGFVDLSNDVSTIRHALATYKSSENYRVMPSFGIAVVTKYLGAQDKRLAPFQTGDDAEFLIKYIPQNNYKTYQGDSILHNPIKYKEELTDKIVLVGEIGASTDMHFTPLNDEIAGKSYPDMYGIYVHANIIYSIISSKPIAEANGWFAVHALFLLVSILLLAGILYFYGKAYHSLFHYLVIFVYEPGVLLTQMFVSVYLFQWHIHIEFETPYIIFYLLPSTVYLADYIDHLINKKRVRIHSYFVKIRNDAHKT